MGAEKRRPVACHHNPIGLAFFVKAAGAAPIRVIRLHTFDFYMKDFFREGDQGWVDPLC